MGSYPDQTRIDPLLSAPMLAPPKITDEPPSGTLDAAPAIDGIDRSTRVFEPPSGFVLTAIARHKLIICLCAVLFALLGAAYGLSRPRTYTASASLQVGQVNPNSPGFYGYVQSATSLALAFSRSIEAEPVLVTIQHKLKLAPSVAVARLSAEPIPLSPVFRVIATGPTQTAAIQLANVTAGAVIAYEGKSNSSNPEAESLLHEYRDASLGLRHAVEHLAHVSHKSSGASPETIARAEAAKSAAEVKLRAIANSYVGTVASQAPRSGLVTLIAGAATATSNRKSKVELLTFIGLLAGVVIGCLAAILLERLQAARRRTAGSQARTQSSQPA
jgi:capsular polysaccharide biosynthesis protein